MSNTSHTYIAIDLKSFYASVECVSLGLDPLTANLVVADPSRTEKTICLAVSPSLKAFGIPGRARLFEVYQKLNEYKRRTGITVDFTIAPPRMATYIDVSARIYSIYLKYISPDDIHVYSIDECFMDVTHYLELYHMSAQELARTMILDVLSQTGITATAGIGTNLYLSKIAMDIVAKHVAPDASGVRIASLDEMSYRRLLWSHKPLTDFWRIGPGIARRLEQNGMYTLGDIARRSVYDEDSIYRLFGIDAELLIDHAWGYEPCSMKDIKNYRPSTSCVSSGQVLSCPYTTAKARIIVQEMTDLMVLDLVDQKLATDSVTLTIGYDRCTIDEGSYHGSTVTDRYGRKVPLHAHGTASFGSPTNSTQKILTEVLALYDRIVDPSLMVRRVTVNANNLTEEGFEQFDLFTDPVARAKERKLQEAMLSIKKRYGKNAILKGTNLEEGANTIERNNQIGGHHK
ncbi:MAG: DNA methylase [Agathobacter sp.]|nr:DNA methylase [Agathobacter sp.]